jgi:hypothetical protein
VGLSRGDNDRVFTRFPILRRIHVYKILLSLKTQEFTCDNMDVSDLTSKTDEAQNKEVTLDDAALGFSISTVSSTVLQSLLRSICETIPEAKKKAIEHLLVEKSQIPIPPGSKRDHDAYKGTTDASGQQLGCRRPKYSQCETCKKEFNTLTNNSSACRYHTGKFMSHVVNR